MKLLPEEVRIQLPPLYLQEHVEDPMVICKFFHSLSHWCFCKGNRTHFYFTQNKSFRGIKNLPRLSVATTPN